jgi:diguanylate cyclase (GGDEF)-like protein
MVAVAFLVRAIVFRVRGYSRFARQVAEGRAERAVVVTGNDELSDLGVALNVMVTSGTKERERDHAQAEFSEAMQLTESEEEANELLRRQVERTVPGSEVLTLNRDNSGDRLYPTRELAAGSSLAPRLAQATPRSCLAVRFARTHGESRASEPLIRCEVCGGTAEFSTCEPLLVGGEVIGAVLASHPRPISRSEEDTLRRSVTQAAPVLGNLRNLAIAERRAQTDALTGLPNKRQVADVVRRTVAHASRSFSPLAALALDLDHFKPVNDTFGHAAGDDVLAAVGSTLKTACRESDFVGRAGGEEFLILLPDTGLEAAKQVAEKVRHAVSTISVPTVERAITTSIGVAVMPDDAGDATTLLRNADRALYAAKKNGRNRVECFSREMLEPTPARVRRPGDAGPTSAAPNGRGDGAPRKAPAKS